nr:glycosyltransferase family A protein [uncultured Carboxylicivirga sp.]
MLSICIPVYNYIITELVESLHQQITANNHTAEIIIIDDGSSENYRVINRKVSDHHMINYYEQNNQGRSKTRNNLAAKANGNNLIFIDCDCAVLDNYLNNYASNIHQAIVIGGLAYAKQPKQKELRLRWRYGIKRECAIDYTRNKIGFLSSNFMIQKQLFASIGFDENITQYGHEDTLLGLSIRRKGYQPVQINNPVIHLGIDDAKTFLKKTEQAIISFHYILIQNPLDKDLLKNNQAKLFKLKTPLILNKSISFIYKILKVPIGYFLSKIYPSLNLFDLYKVLYIFHVKSATQNNQSNN